MELKLDSGMIFGMGMIVLKIKFQSSFDSKE